MSASAGYHGLDDTVQPRDTSPAGWGTQVRVALGSSLGWATDTYSEAQKKYTIDLADKQAFPGTPCPVADYQTPINGNAVLVMAGVPVTSFDVQITYPAKSGSSSCVMNYRQTVKLLGYQNSCSIESSSSNSYCP